MERRSDDDDDKATGLHFQLSVSELMITNHYLGRLYPNQINTTLFCFYFKPCDTFYPIINKLLPDGNVAKMVNADNDVSIYRRVIQRVKDVDRQWLVDFITKQQNQKQQLPVLGRETESTLGVKDVVKGGVSLTLLTQETGQSNLV